MLSEEDLQSDQDYEEIMEDITRDDRFQKKPTNLTEVVKHLPDDVFEKRPFRAYMAALQVRNRGKKTIGMENEYSVAGEGLGIRKA